MYVPSSPNGDIVAKEQRSRSHITTHEQGAKEELERIRNALSESFVAAPFPYDGKYGDDEILEMERLGNMHSQWKGVDLHREDMLPAGLQTQIANQGKA